MGIDLGFRSTTELASALRERQVGSLELLEHFCSRAARHDPKLNAIVALDLERARTRALEADAALARGESWGPLHGLPMTIKDSIEVAGMPTTSGAPELRDHWPATHAPAAERAVAAGAIVFGKTNLPIYAGDVQTYNAVHGTTRNPWNPERTPGGSSGGSAAALAAGLTGFEIGSDIGGSIRNPAHYCGVYGLKPSYGVVPSRGHIPGPPGTLSESDLGVLGPMGRSAADLALGLHVLAGPDEWDARAYRVAMPPSRHDRLRDFRVGVWMADASCPVSQDVDARLHGAVEAVARSGASLDPHTRPVDGAASFAIYLRLLYGVLAGGFPAQALKSFDASAATLSDDDQSLPSNLVRGASQRHREWTRDHEARTRLRAAWHDYFREHDVLLAPIMPTTAFPHDHSEIATRTIAVDGVAVPYFQTIFWAGLASVAYLPAVVAPIGLAGDGLPVGIQIVAPYLEDHTAIRFAELLAAEVGGFAAPPGFA